MRTVGRGGKVEGEMRGGKGKGKAEGKGGGGGGGGKDGEWREGIDLTGRIMGV